MRLSKEDLQKVVDAGNELDIKVIGMLIIADDVPAQLAELAINSLTVHGSFKAKPEIKALF